MIDSAIAWMRRNPTNAASAALAVVTTTVLLVLLALGKLDGVGAAALIVVVLICAYLSLAGREVAMDRAMAWIKENPTNAAFAGLALGTTAVVVVLLARGKLDGAGAAALIVVVIICALLSVAGRELVDRIVKLGPVEFSPRVDLPGPTFDQNLASGVTFAPGGASPWESTPMTSGQRWHYEQATTMLAHLRQHGQLQGDRQLQKFRDLILEVGEAALNEGEFAKGLDILKLLEPVREKTANELLSLGTAHLWSIYGDDIGKEQHQGYLKKALLYLEKTTRADPTHAMAFWSLGYVYDELERYPPAISSNEEARRLDPRLLPWANWHIAISLLKLAKLVNVADAAAKTGEAMGMLQAIPPGLWWQPLYDDGELEELRRHAYYGEIFRRLFEEGQRADETDA